MFLGKHKYESRIQDHELPKDFVTQQSAILKSITVDEVNAIAKKRLPYDKMIIVVVGDKAKIYDGLLKLGYEVIELDTDGNPLVKEEDKMKEAEPTRAPNPQPPSNGKQRAKVVPIDPVRPVK